MITFQVQDMTCGHCVAALTRAVPPPDPGPPVTVDLAAHRVGIEPVRADGPALARAIEEAGYTPVVIGG